MALSRTQVFLLCYLIQLVIGASIASDETVEELIDQTISKLQKLKAEFKSCEAKKKNNGSCVPCNSIQGKQHCDCTNLEPMQDCLAFLKDGFKKSGLYRLQGVLTKKVYCDQKTFNGGWTVFQRRQDGSVDFAQNWNTYKSGFGQPEGEFWMGNEYMHALTKHTVAPKKSQFLINMVIQGQPVYAMYDSFEIGNEASKYPMTFKRGGSGNASSVIDWSIHYGFKDTNHKFSTYDQDNDSWPGSCSQALGRVGWWFAGCYAALLNGVYKFTDPSSGQIQWYNQQQPTFVEMKFRRQTLPNPTNTPSKSTYTPSNPTHTQSTTAHTESKPTHTSSNPTHTPSTTTQTPSTSTHTQSKPTHTQSKPTYTPSNPTHTPSTTTQTPSNPTHNPSTTTHTPSTSTHTQSKPTHTQSKPTYTPSNPTHTPSTTTQTPSFPTHNPSTTTHTPSKSTQTTSKPTYTPSNATHTPLTTTQTPSTSTNTPSNRTYTPSNQKSNGLHIHARCFHVFIYVVLAMLALG